MRMNREHEGVSRNPQAVGEKSINDKRQEGSGEAGALH